MPREKKEFRRITINLRHEMYESLAEQGGTVTDQITRAVEQRLVLDAIAGDSGYVTGIDAVGNELNIILDPGRFAVHMANRQSPEATI